MIVVVLGLVVTKLVKCLDDVSWTPTVDSLKHHETQLIFDAIDDR